MQNGLNIEQESVKCLEKKNGLLEFGADLHSNVEIIFLFEGETNVWVGSKGAVTAQAGDVIVVFPNQQYRYETIKKEDCIVLIVDVKRLSSELLNVFFSYSPTSNVIKGAAKNEDLKILVRSALRAYKQESGEYRETVLKGYATALIGKLLPLCELRKNEIEEMSTLSEIMKYCNLHFRERLSLSALERELHINKYYISHIINEGIGKGFNEYINSIRINEASRLLLESKMTIKEISGAVGFGTVRTFDRVFKSQKGETATEYRERNSEKIKKD